MKLSAVILIFSLVSITLAAPSRKKRGLDKPLRGQLIIIGDEVFYVEERTSWTEGEPPANHAQAQEVCTLLDMDLPDIATPEKEAAVVEALGTIVDGYSTKVMPFWTSALRGSDDRWMWTNLGQEVSYVNWGSEPRPGRNWAFLSNDNGGGRPTLEAVLESPSLPLVLCQEMKKP